MTKTPKQLTGSFTLKAIVLLSAVVLMTVTMPASASPDVDVREQAQNPELIIMCHNGFEIQVHLSAVPAHVAHGDPIGSCEQHD